MSCCSLSRNDELTSPRSSAVSRGGRTAVLQSGTTLEPDFLLLGVGVRSLLAAAAMRRVAPTQGDRAEIHPALANSGGRLNRPPQRGILKFLRPFALLIPIARRAVAAVALRPVFNGPLSALHNILKTQAPGGGTVTPRRQAVADPRAVQNSLKFISIGRPLK
jgi:hypothetical protein